MYNECKYGSDLDEGSSMEVKMGRMRNRGVRFERKGMNNIRDEVDVSMGNIRMSIPPFK